MLSAGAPGAPVPTSPSTDPDLLFESIFAPRPTMLCPTYPLGELDFPFPFVVLNIFAFAALLTSMALRIFGDVI